MRAARARPMTLLTTALLLLLLAPAPPAAALERLLRKFDLERGLPFSEISSVKQDARGFIWIATGGGLFRYDGVELRPWPRSTTRSFLRWVAPGPHGELLVTDYRSTLLQVEGTTLAPVPGPGGPGPVLQWPPAWDGEGRLWIVSAARLWLRSAGGEWSEYPPSKLGAEKIVGVDAAGDGTLLVSTVASVWRVRADFGAVRLAAIDRIGKAIPGDDGAVVVLQQDGRVVEAKGMSQRELFRMDARPLDIVRQGRSIWVSFDTSLVRLDPGEPPEILKRESGIPSGGPLLVDDEGSLWMGTFRGLVQYPAPGTVAWGVTDGMASSGARRLARGPEGVWVDSWGGLTLLRRTATSWRPEPISGSQTSPVCAGSDGTLWAGARGRFLERRGGAFVEHADPDLELALDCAAGREGRIWFVTSHGLVLARARGPSDTITEKTLPPIGEGGLSNAHLFEDASGQLWFASGDDVCRTDAAGLAAGAGVTWSCSKARGAGRITGFAQLSTGSLWAATLQAGVYRLGPDGAWEPMPGSSEIPTRLIRRLRASPSGGAWIISYGTIARAVERPDAAQGWEIVERPSPWHGLMISDAEDVLEEDSGDLWIATLAGLVHIPGEVRRAALPVPRVELVDVLVDGAPLDWERSVELPYSRNRIDIHFAGLSYRDPALLRYQVRLRPGAPWLSASGRPSFQFVDLPPGSYHPEVRASLDGAAWSPVTAGLSFAVLPPFWRTWWFTSLAALAIASAAYAVYRYRLAHLLRLERMRTRIAADLHDDIGSSLSRIAIQSDLVLTPASLGPPDAERLLMEIGASARSLVDSMSDIVWSIDPKRDDLSSLIARLRQYALGILEPGGVALEISSPPDAMKARLAPERRRHLYLFLKEAIHNIAKHAACRKAEITMRLEAGRLHVEVSDDGRGFDVEAVESAAPPPRGGHGLPGMRARAGQLGGRLTIASVPGKGTALKLTCAVDRWSA